MSRTLSVPFAFWIVLLSVFSALIIASIFSALDPSILDGSKPSLSTYISMFFGQAFLIVPVLIFLTRKQLPIIESLRINPISKEVTKLMSDQDYLDQIMKTGKDKAIAVAEPVLTKVYDIVGFANT